MNARAATTYLRRYNDALRFRDFRWIWLGSLGGQSAYWALIVARGILVLEMTGSSALVGVATFAAMGPRFIVPPLAGYLADRFDRRSVVAVAYTCQFLNVALLTLLAFAGTLQVWHIVVLSLLNGSFRTFQMTSTQALIPNLVPREHWLNAIAMNQVSLQGARLIGPGLIAPALLIDGPNTAFLACTFMYFASIIGVLAVRTRSTGELARGSNLAASLLAALRYVMRDSNLRVLFVIVAFHCAMTMSFESMLPVLARDTLGDANASVSYLMMGVGGGALIGVFAIAGIQSASVRGSLLLISGVLSGASMLVLALANNEIAAIFGTAAMGGSQAAFMAIGGAMIQTLAPDGMRGRITGLSHILIGGNMAFVNLINGIAADYFGVPAILWVLGLGFVVVMALSLAFANVRNVYGGAVMTPARAT